MIADDGILSSDPDCPGCGTRARSHSRWWRCGGCGLVILMVGDPAPQLSVEIGAIRRDPPAYVGPLGGAGRV